jgi:hypothetical protein
MYCFIYELPNYYTTRIDLFVDALLESETKISPAIEYHMSWANVNKTPVLSIDSPSGVNLDNGAFPVNHYITPEWILYRGALYTGCTSRNVTWKIVFGRCWLSFLYFHTHRKSHFALTWKLLNNLINDIINIKNKHD